MSIKKNRDLMVEQIKRLNGQLNEDRAYDTTQVMYKGAIEIKKEITRLLKKYSIGNEIICLTRV